MKIDYEIENLPLDMGEYNKAEKNENNFVLSLKQARNNL